MKDGRNNAKESLNTELCKRRRTDQKCDEKYSVSDVAWNICGAVYHGVRWGEREVRQWRDVALLGCMLRA